MKQQKYIGSNYRGTQKKKEKTRGILPYHNDDTITSRRMAKTQKTNGE